MIRNFILLTSFLICALSSWSQETYKHLIQITPQINAKEGTAMLPTDHDTWETMDFDKLIAIINKDAISFFDLNEKYNTDLKKQAFKKTAEYTESILPSFNKICQKVKNKNFYVLYNLCGNSAYNTTKRNFSFSIGINDYNTTRTAGYIGLGNLFCTTYPSGYLSVKKTRTSAGDYFHSQYVSTPKISEDIALKIENSMENPYCSVCLMFIVKPTKISRETVTTNFGGYVGTQSYINSCILANTVGLYIVDTDTEEIICDLSSILTTQSSTSSKAATSKRTTTTKRK
jgi:hypothetical protein